jgi:hypothetical protein
MITIFHFLHICLHSCLPLLHCPLGHRPNLEQRKWTKGLGFGLRDDRWGNNYGRHTPVSISWLRAGRRDWFSVSGMSGMLVGHRKELQYIITCLGSLRAGVTAFTCACLSDWGARPRLQRHRPRSFSCRPAHRSAGNSRRESIYEKCPASGYLSLG